MMDSLFGVELPLAARFFIAFVVVLALIAGTFWLIRRFSATRVGAGQARGRQPRLAVIDAAAVDSRRRLVLIRRDNVEHLVMIGGPSDMVIEQNIVRAVPVAAPRETAPPRGPGETVTRGADMVRPEPPTRAAPAADQNWSPPPLPETIRPRPDPVSRASETSRPLPESIAAMRGPSLPESRQPDSRQPEPRQQMSRAPADPLPVEVRQSPPTADVNLSDMAQRLEAALRRPSQALDTRPEPPPRPAPPREPQARSAPPPRPAPPAEPAPRPAVQRPAPPPLPAPHPEPQARQAPPPAAFDIPPPPRPAASPSAGQAAPRESEPAPQTVQVVEPAVAAAAPPRPEPPKSETAKPEAAKPEAVRPASSKSVFDSLEEEMASLLGKPTDKP